jgi:hypothetical protein
MPSSLSYLVLVGAFLIISLLVRFMIAHDVRKPE